MKRKPWAYTLPTEPMFDRTMRALPEYSHSNPVMPVGSEWRCNVNAGKSGPDLWVMCTQVEITKSNRSGIEWRRIIIMDDGSTS
ncbi:MAG: hypothetical protein COA96_16875 [SAR86 cluster bacterium]|uniref:Uncharacterized protein n=1 Tax=SAR86 cluster bacterium TaxID=2030880 RepID=A0A2A5AG32_9GAMM|nr:MAG: hypothetical protein COA96_16875 [SAR86 cluster bacterium]